MSIFIYEWLKKTNVFLTWIAVEAV
eukprot:COSAG06_NODE_26457_length_614_cov_1.180583_2_plen_24_part_01